MYVHTHICVAVLCICTYVRMYSEPSLSQSPLGPKKKFGLERFSDYRGSICAANCTANIESRTRKHFQFERVSHYRGFGLGRFPFTYLLVYIHIRTYVH